MLQLCYFELNKCLSEKSVIIHILRLFLSNNNPKAGSQVELKVLWMIAELPWVLQYVCDAISQMKHFVVSTVG